MRTPVNSFEFHRCRRTPQVDHLTLSLGRCTAKGTTASDHRLRRGLPGYLILFATRAFVPQRQFRASTMPTLSVFLMVSMHFTATPQIPPTSIELKPCSINGTPMVEPLTFTADLQGRLRTL